MNGPKTRCRCGSMRDERAICVHCDMAADCGKSCDRCTQRDSWCAICRGWCGTPAAARAHEDACRKAERRTEPTR